MDSISRSIYENQVINELMRLTKMANRAKVQREYWAARFDIESEYSTNYEKETRRQERFSRFCDACEASLRAARITAEIIAENRKLKKTLEAVATEAKRIAEASNHNAAQLELAHAKIQEQAEELARQDAAIHELTKFHAPSRVAEDINREIRKNSREIASNATPTG